MQLLVALIAGLASLALGLLVMFQGGQRRIGWLLVAHGVTVGVFLGIPQSPSTPLTGSGSHGSGGGWVSWASANILLSPAVPMWNTTTHASPTLTKRRQRFEVVCPVGSR